MGDARRKMVKNQSGQTWGDVGHKRLSYQCGDGRSGPSLMPKTSRTLPGADSQSVYILGSSVETKNITISEGKARNMRPPVNEKERKRGREVDDEVISR